MLEAPERPNGRMGVYGRKRVLTQDGDSGEEGVSDGVDGPSGDSGSGVTRASSKSLRSEVRELNDERVGDDVLAARRGRKRPLGPRVLPLVFFGLESPFVALDRAVVNEIPFPKDSSSKTQTYFLPCFSCPKTFPCLGRIPPLHQNGVAQPDADERQ